MLYAEPTKRNGGFTLWGDPLTLRNLHELIFQVSEVSPVLHAEGILMALAYDIRKAFEGKREKHSFTAYDDQFIVYGVEQLWPTFIAQVALLRTGLSFTSSTKRDQSLAYLLEGVMEEVVEEAFPVNRIEIMHGYQALCGTSDESINDTIGSRASFFMAQTPGNRKKLLPSVIFSLTPMWESLHEIRARTGSAGPLSPDDFANYSWQSMDEMTGAKYAI